MYKTELEKTIVRILIIYKMDKINIVRNVNFLNYGYPIINFKIDLNLTKT